MKIHHTTKVSLNALFNLLALSVKVLILFFAFLTMWAWNVLGRETHEMQYKYWNQEKVGLITRVWMPSFKVMDYHEDRHSNRIYEYKGDLTFQFKKRLSEKFFQAIDKRIAEGDPNWSLYNGIYYFSKKNIENKSRLVLTIGIHKNFNEGELRWVLFQDSFDSFGERIDEEE